MAISPTIAAAAAAAASAAAAGAMAGSAQAAPAAVLAALKPGDVLTALVLQTLADGTARLAVGDALLDVASQVPLAAGSTVTLTVQSTNAGLTLALLDSDGAQASQTGAAPARAPAAPAAAAAAAVDKAASPEPVAAAAAAPQPRAEAAVKPAVAALAQAVRGAAARQDSLAPLFANATEVAQAEALPRPVRQAIAQLLALRTPTAAPITADTVRQAMSRSGLFLEARLAAAPPAAAPAAAAPPAAGLPAQKPALPEVTGLGGLPPPPADLKAALLVLRQVLQAWVGDMPATATETGGHTAQPTAQPTGSPPTETPQEAPLQSTGWPAAGVPRTVEAPRTAGVQPSANTAAIEAEESGTTGPRGAVAARPLVVIDRALLPQPPAAPSGTGEVIASGPGEAEPSFAAPSGGTQTADKAPGTEAKRVPSAAVKAGAPVAPAALLAMLERSVLPARPGLWPEASSFPDGRLPDRGQPENGGEGSRARSNAPAVSGLPASRPVDLLERALSLPDVTPRGTDAKGMPARADAAPEEAAPRAKSAPEPSAPPSPPYRGGPTAAQPATTAGIAADADPRVVGERLLGETDAALARHTLLQAASLPDGAGLDQSDRTAPRWAFEIPLATPQGTAVAQFEIARDGRNGAPSVEAKPAWRARFTLDIEPIGPVHVQIALSGARAGVTLWAERQESAARLRADAPLLADALREIELEPGDLMVRDGQPPRSAAAAGHFLDRAS